MRDLRYKSAVSYQTIRPKAVLRALAYLVCTNDTMYSSVTVRDNWVSESATDDTELWNALVKSDETMMSLARYVLQHKSMRITLQMQNQHLMVKQKVKTRTKRHRQPAEGPVNNPQVISIAPGDGQTLLSLFTDKDSEVMAFPRLFPTGQFGHAAQKPVRLTLRKYFNARLVIRLTVQEELKMLHENSAKELGHHSQKHKICHTEKITQENWTLKQVYHCLTLWSVIF